MNTTSRQRTLQKKYQALHKKIKRAIQKERFEQYAATKKAALLRRLARYERRLLQKGVAVAGIAALMLNAAPLQAQAPARTGAEFRVNETTTNGQVVPSIAVDSDGDYVVVWQSDGQAGGDGFDIYAQRYDKFGNTVGNEFRVNTYTTSTQRNPSVGMDSDGNFVIVWDSYGQDGDYTGIYAQRYKCDGTTDGTEFQVNTYTTSYQSSPSIAVDRDGDFVIAWEDGDFFNSGQDGSVFGIYAQRYKNDGTTDGAEFRVNTYTTGFQRFPSIAVGSDGDFIIAWQSNGQDGDSYGIYARRYTNSGTMLGAGTEFLVNTYTTSRQINPSVGIDNDGDFVIAWESFGQDGNRDGIYAQRYDRNGSRAGSEFQVNTYTTSFQIEPSVGMDNNGDFVIAWESYGQDGNLNGIYAQRYRKDGNTIGAEFQVNTYTTNSQRNSSIGIDKDGDFIIAWRSYGQDGDRYGIYAQRYENALPFKSDEFRVNKTTTNRQLNPSIAVDSDGDYVITWASNGQVGGNGYDIYAQRYDRFGSRAGSEFRVNTYTTGSQSFPSIGIDNDGDFVITWQSYGQDGDGYGIYAQRYSKDGTPAIEGEFRVNSTTTSSQNNPSIAIDNDGDFVVAWESYDQNGSSYAIYAQRYNNNGQTNGSEFLVSMTTNDQRAPSVAVDNDGDFVIVWQSYGQDGSYYGIYARRYDNNGQTNGNEFLVNTYTTGFQSSPSVAVDDSGDFIIAWESYGQDGSYYGIYAQRYNNNGQTNGNEFQVNTYTTGYQRFPSIGIDNDGDFVIAWQSNGQDGASYGIYVQRYDKNGNTVGNEFQVNTYTTASQSNPSIGIDNDGDFVIAWQSDGQDGDRTGIYARRYEDTELPLGVESQVNGVTTGNQVSSSVAVDSDGDYIIVWQSYEQVGGNGFDIYAQRYHKDGTTNGGEFRVNTFTIGSQSGPSVAMDDTGAFVVAWESAGQPGGDGYDVYIQRYNNLGMPASSMEVLVNSFTTGNQDSPSVGVDSDGDFIVVWESSGQDGDRDGVYAQRYDNNGQTNGTEFQVNTYTTSNQRRSSVSMDSDGDFVITWVSLGQDGDSYGIYARRYTNGGSTPGNEFQVNTYTTGVQSFPDVAVDSDGDFVITWESYGQDGSSYGVYARRYDNNGTPVEDQFLVNCFTTSNQGIPSVGMDSDGDFVITWTSNGQDESSFGIYAQRYDRNGRLIGEEFQVNSFTSSSQVAPSIGVDSDGDFVIAWQSFGQDGDGFGIYAQRYQGNKSTTFCQTTLALPNETITIDTKYQAEQNITSQQVLAAPNAIISYTAGNSITLKTGFHAQPGVNFTAKIAPVNCSSSSLNEEVVERRVEEQAAAVAEELSIALAPNPVSEFLQLKLESQASGKVSLQIIDLNGRIVLSQVLFLQAGQQTTQLDVSQLAAGTYFLKVQNSELVVQQKFVKLQY